MAQPLWWKRVFQTDLASLSMKTESATLGGWVRECFFWRTVQDCFVQVVSLYPAEIKSLFVPCRDKICQSTVNVSALVYKRGRDFYYLASLSSLCPALSGCTSQAKLSRVCVCVCVCSPFVKVFCGGSLLLYHPLSSKSVPCWTISVVYGNVIAFAPHLPGAKKSVLCSASHLPNAANCLYVK